MLGKTVTTTTANGNPETPSEDISRKELFASEFSLALMEKWFSSHEFLAGIPKSDKIYKHPGSKYKNSFYPFNDQLNYGLAHYFVKSKTTKGNVNKFTTDALMALFTEKLSYKNADEWILKLSKISWHISDNKWIEHRFNVESGVFGITRQEIAIQL